MELTLGMATRPWDQWSFSEACQAVASAGFKDIAPYFHQGSVPINAGSTAKDVAAFRKTIESAGLRSSMLITTTILHRATLEEAESDYRRVIRVAADAGITWVMNGGCEMPEKYQDYNALFSRCAPYAAENGVRLVMKPHGGNGLTGKVMKKVVQTVNHPSFSICYDPANIIYYTNGEVRPEQDVHDIKEHVSVCIIKDCVIKAGEPDVHLFPGEGLVDLPRVLKTLADAGFHGPLYIECLGGTEWDDINDRARRARVLVSEIVRKI